MMSRKSIIISLIVLALMIAGVGVAVVSLYSGVDVLPGSKKTQVTVDGSRRLIAAVPSDAALVACFSDARTAAVRMIPSLEMPESMRKSGMAVSLHYSGKLIPLYVFEAPKDEAVAADLAERLRAAGLNVDASVASFIVASESDPLVKSSLRHLDKKVSVLDASGFDRALASVSGGNVVIISNSHVSRLFPAVLTQRHSVHSGFFSRVSDWMAFDLTSDKGGLSLHGAAVHDNDATEFMTVLQKSAASSSSVSSILPSNTLFALSFPMRGTEPYVSAYQSYLDTRQRLQTNMADRLALKKRCGIDPQQLMESLDVREVAAARYMTNGKMNKVSLLKVGKRDAVLVDSIDYAAVVPALFGNLFACDAGAESVMVDGWIISGNPSALECYKDGKAPEHTLKNLFEDAGHADMTTGKSTSMMAWFSFTEEPAALNEIFAYSFLKNFRTVYDGADVAPLVLTVSQEKEGMSVDLNLRKLTLKNTDADKFAADTAVAVSKGPFKVKNSGTGKMNDFFQTSSLSLCLQEDGKELWNVPFSQPVCGTAQTVDFFANGKLQILFGAGSRVWLYDRLGRRVNDLDLDLGKEILLGPAVYDFSGKKKYNIMVLHKDNTIAMYNLKGAKPSSWKDITVSEGVIKALPERIDLGGSTFWVVRTSVETLIFPFYGGSPLTMYSGNQRIRPDSQVKAVDGTSVEVTCYDGKVRTLALK